MSLFKKTHLYLGNINTGEINVHFCVKNGKKNW